jgi:hypothetical protein
MNQTRIRPCRLTALLLTLLLMLAMSPAALADTDENTPRIAQQPEQLVLQLGVRWAGVEFELRTDAGRFPVPVVVDESGVLTMDLGGSTTYTLSCMESSVPVPSPEPEPEAEPQPESPPETGEPSSPSAAHVLLVLAVLLLVAVILAALFFAKRQHQSPYDSWEDEEEPL